MSPGSKFYKYATGWRRNAARRSMRGSAACVVKNLLQAALFRTVGALTMRERSTVNGFIAFPGSFRILSALDEIVRRSRQAKYLATAGGGAAGGGHTFRQSFAFLSNGAK